MNHRRQYLRWSVGLLAATAVGAVGAANTVTGLPALAGRRQRQEEAGALVWRERALLGFGTTLWLKAAHADAERVEAALAAAVQAIREVEGQMSLFDPASALARLNARGELRSPPPHLLAVLRHAQQVSRASHGAFDASMQPLWTLWSQAAAQGSLPSAALMESSRQLVNWRAIEASPSMVRLNLRGMQLSLNGIAQGYASDLVRQVLRSHGIRHAMVDTGETSVLGQPPGRPEWALAIEDGVGAPGAKRPFPLQVPDGRAIATSSDAHTVFSADRRHHHILDPQTGDSPAWWSSVTVIAASCTQADALTKVFFMTPPAQVAALARRWDVTVVLQDKQGRWMQA